MLANESKARQKRGRPIGSKDKTPRKIRKINKEVGNHFKGNQIEH